MWGYVLCEGRFLGGSVFFFWKWERKDDIEADFSAVLVSLTRFLGDCALAAMFLLYGTQPWWWWKVRLGLRSWGVVALGLMSVNRYIISASSSEAPRPFA